MATTIHSLPNELILHTLSLLPTTQLLPLTTVSHRFHALVIRLLSTRLQSTCADHALILEIYHPSAKLTEPPLDCSYQGTSSSLDTCVDLNALRNVYSIYKPRRRLSDRRRRRTVIRIPGDIPGSRTHPSAIVEDLNDEEEAPKQILSLEGHELFTQLCANTDVIRLGPATRIFRPFVKVQEGVVRVWKHWLSERAKPKSPSSSHSIDDAFVLWIDAAKNVGLRVRVTEKSWRRNVPVLMHADEEPNVSYEVEYLTAYVRTSHMLLMLEKSAEEEDANSGKAVVFGNFR